MVRRPLSNDFNVDYEVKDGEDLVAIGKVTGGKIEMLSVKNDIQSESFAGNILSRLVGTIVRDADMANANLSIKLTDSEDISMKRFLERFGFRETSEGILKRNAGSIHPPSVGM
jgi:citrate lyase synthetase